MKIIAKGKKNCSTKLNERPAAERNERPKVETSTVLSFGNIDGTLVLENHAPYIIAIVSELGKWGWAKTAFCVIDPNQAPRDYMQNGVSTTLTLQNP